MANLFGGGDYRGAKLLSEAMGLRRICVASAEGKSPSVGPTRRRRDGEMRDREVESG